MKREYATLTRHLSPVLVHGKWFQGSPTVEQVRVIARAEGYAMVRFPRASPFCVPERELSAPYSNDRTEPKP